MLTIRLLGPLSLACDEGPVAVPARRHAQLLLSYLALHPGLHTRADLAALLWPDVLRSSARSSLRSALASIRAALGGQGRQYLLTPSDRVGLAGSADVSVDVLEFQRLVREGRLEAALELVGGELGQGLEAGWIWDAREEHCLHVSDLLSTLADRAERGGDLISAITFTRRLVSLDPLAELANRDLMRRLASSGDRASALGAYAKLSERLRSDLRIAPSAQTRAVLDSIRSPEPHSHTTAETALTLPQPCARVARDAFVGREGSLERLDAALRRTPLRETQIVLVAGDGGIGKTRLLCEFAADAHERDTTVLFGRCHGEPAVSYEPFVEALRHYIVSAPVARLEREVPQIAGELRVLLPELDERVPGLPAPIVGDADGELGRLQRAMLEALLATASTQRVLLVLDDIQAADPPTIGLLEHLLSASNRSQLLIAAAYRTSEVSDALARVVARARHLPGATEINLDGLDEMAVEQLLRALRPGSPPPRGVVSALTARTGGNPLLIESLLNGLGGRTGDESSCQWGPLIDVDTALPSRAIDLLCEARRRLSPTARAALAIAATIGDEFELALVALVAGSSEGQTLDALDEAIAAAVIREAAGLVGRYEFCHALMRESVLAGLTATRRAHLHRQIAGALEQMHADQPELPVKRIAEQLLGARELVQPRRTADYVKRAAHEAERAHAHADAAALYARAADRLAPSRRAPDVRRRCELMICLGHARRRAGDAHAVRDAFEDAAKLARSITDATLLAEAALGTCSVPFFPGETLTDTTAVELLEDALELLEPASPALRARLLSRLARELYFSANREQRDLLVNDALSLARSSGDVAALGDALEAAHVLRAGDPDAPARLGVADEMIKLAVTNADIELLVRGRVRRAVDLLEQGDLEGMSRERDELGRLAAKLNQPAYHWWPTLWQASEAILHGRIDEGERLARTAFAIGQPAFGDAAELDYHAQLYWLRLQHDNGKAPSLDAETLSTRFAGLPVWRCAHTASLARTGKLDQAQVLVAELTGPSLAKLRRDSAWHIAASLLAEACATVRDPGAAQRLYDALLPSAGIWAVSASGSVCMCPVAHPLAVLAATIGRRQDAFVHFTAALDQAAAVSAIPLLARIERDRTTLLTPVTTKRDPSDHRHRGHSTRDRTSPLRSPD